MSSTLISELNCAPNFEAGQKLIFISQVERGLPICLCRMKQIRGETRCDPNRRLKGKVRPPRAWKGTDNIFNVQCNKCLLLFQVLFPAFWSPFTFLYGICTRLFWQCRGPSRLHTQESVLLFRDDYMNSWSWLWGVCSPLKFLICCSI